MKREPIITLAALFAALAVAAGAAGAHAFQGHVQAANWMKTGAEFQLIHAVAVIAVQTKISARCPAILLLVGSGIFSFTLYALAFGAPKFLAHFAPIGGFLMILGWFAVAYSAWYTKPKAE
ncbi:DUF423 domain-containing protein [Zymomonas mobilis]|uniref:DUF423 domain-containing protein n=1 Tax=Zymomonas mobilis subsp. pomaceae (strain ATCC 29192 / DSM 22645 / JCM 10191 / CCUG 17912 / NBRC 13757 / NCIMB 11200 / NRRL B-4491 / Barker I) TaxID=579138 RepID=F8ERS1_ZYMMT|nr:DUF423 domain-containing protein [Zymomonas mobilis]AEI37529.1 protein of unknown function DUF423 [Zymomonas mobilis subsp. pomaceae ATCC 29192]MDX5948897.1 DUF423 domain-containing protein [Zymomonas mobilis subsp. pomaceae]GEB88703.1 DUF423 domain-containing protein [Zymomonas mobilis subsp. pomaceae]